MSEYSSSPQFQKLLSGRVDIDLVQFMLELAADAYPNLDQLTCLVEIDRLGVDCCDSLAACKSPCPQRRLAAISQCLYDVEGFHGNRDAYYEPQNSYLNEVLARRTGIPISLGILHMAVAARAGVGLFGVNTPGHFVLGCKTAGETWFVDPFNGGDVLDQADCKRRILLTVGTSAQIADEHFRPASGMEIAVRVLRNLKTAHAMHERFADLLSVQRRLVALLPQSGCERRDLGLVYLRLGQPGEALESLEQFSAECESQQAQEIQPSIRQARRMLAELN